MLSVSIYRFSDRVKISYNRTLCESVWNPEPFTYAVINVFRAIKYVICLQYLLKTNKKSESEKAQQNILVATEHLPIENMVILLKIKLELPLKIGIQLFRTPLFFFSPSFEGLSNILKYCWPFLENLVKMQKTTCSASMTPVTFVVCLMHIIILSIDNELYLFSMLGNPKIQEITLHGFVL